METKQIIPTLLSGDLDEERLQLHLASRRLALDTETMGLATARDRLCLVQMRDEAGHVTLVRITSRQAPRLQQLLEDPGVEKVIHFARFDMAAVQHWLGIRMTPVFCTKIASKIARTYTDQHGLKYLAREIMGIDMDKQEQSSDWGGDTLSPAQLAYAVADVLHLLPIQERLLDMLRREGRLDLARACIAFLPARVALDLAGWENDPFAHS